MTDPFSLTHRNRHKSAAERSFASAWKAASANESLGVPRLMARHLRIPCEINQLAAGAHPATDADSCLTDSRGMTISGLHASAAHGASPETPGKANENKEVKGFW